MTFGIYAPVVNKHLETQSAPAFFKENAGVLEPLRDRLVKNFSLDVSLRDLRLECVPDNKYQAKYACQFKLSIGGDNGINLARFTLDLYPACCALHQLNDFYFHRSLDKETIASLLQWCLSAYGMILTRPKRLMINFVEASREDMFKYDDVVPPYDTQVMNYQTFYDWAKEKAHLEQMFVNHNTNRIIHNVIVTL
jgi:hypothetical protein